MANEEETKTKRSAEEPVEIQPDNKLRSRYCASKKLDIEERKILKSRNEK